MKESKAVHVTKRDLKETFYKIQDTYSNIDDRKNLKDTDNNRNIGCQFDSKRNNLTCKCRYVSTYRRRDMTYFSGLTKQVYTCQGVRSFTDIGVGNVKVLQKKKVKKIYLPETNDRGVGSEDWSAYFSRRNRQRDDGSHYRNKITSSKCVGGIVDYKTGPVISRKLSPIVRTRSGTTSPSTPTFSVRNNEIGSNTVERDTMTITTQVENDLLNTPVNGIVKLDNYISVYGSDGKNAKLSNNNKEVKLAQGIGYTEKIQDSTDRTISSDSLVQHVHNLEDPSRDKISRMSVDHIENNIEREYRNIFTSKEKDKELNQEIPKQDLKSASVLRRRFEALRRGFVRKEDSVKTDVIVNKLSSQISRHSRRDVSIVSDPPSLEGRSFSNTKAYSPIHVNVVPEKPIYKQSNVNNKSYFENERNNTQLSRFEYHDSDYQGVKGMFRLWGKKFNLEEDYYKTKPDAIPSSQIIKSGKNPEQVKNVLKTEPDNKKGKKFFFFKKKIKEKPKEDVKPRKSITAGRCELSQGLMIKIGKNPAPSEEKKKNNMSEEILQKHWLTKYLSRNIESRNSIQIRWNNNTYNTSSSTVFELIDTVYKETGVVLRSNSEVTTGESSYFKSNTQRVNFACKDIEAWMIPKTHQVKPIKIKSKSKDNIEVRISNQKWLIDKSQAFSNNIEVVLHSNNLIRSSKDSSSSSEYLRIDIPKGFFIDSTSSEEDKNNQSSDEEVYKIVEYETEFDTKKNKKDYETGDHKPTNIEVIVSVKDDVCYESNDRETVIKKPPAHRDIVIQGSNVNVPKRCNVIEVGIITQRDLRETRKSILKVPEFLSDEESDIKIRHTPKKCEFAESFLQDYYQNWTPSATGISSWRVSDSNLRCCSENSASSFLNQGDGTKSCPNIYDDFQASAVISSNDPCGACIPCPLMVTSDDDKPDNTFKCKLFKKFKTKTVIGPHECCKRILPKDSFEVFKRRKMYAASNKSKWACPSYGDVKPYSVPSIDDKEAQDTMVECPKSKGSYHQPSVVKPKKRTCKKHVSMPDSETMNETLTHQLANEVPEGILSFKGAGGCEKCKKLEQKCPKHAFIDTDTVCKILDPLCKDNCLNDKNAPCSKTSSKLDDSPICISRPKSSTKSCGPPSPGKAPPVCKPSHIYSPPLPCNPLPVCKPSLSSMATPPIRSSKLPPISKHGSPLCPPSKKSSPFTPCKKCQPRQPISPSRNSRPPTPPCCRKHSPTKELSSICSHFPPCKKTQSSQMSPQHSTQNSSSKVYKTKNSPQSSPQRKKRLTGCIPGCDSKRKEKKSSSNTSLCNTPPCRKLSSPNNETHEKFSWPVKNQVSNQPSIDSVACRPGERLSPTKNPNQCKKYCPLSPNLSSQPLTSKKKKKMDKECKPNCANMPKMQERTLCPPPSTSLSAPSSPPLPPKPVRSKAKISGIFLKMKPSTKKTCSKDCLAWKSENIDSVIKLSSNEKITISLKQQSPSTEEIREGMNIKVKDEDGQTLYERRDYKQDHPNRAGSILGDMYKCSNINTVSTPIIIKNVQTADNKNEKQITESRSGASIANLIEIQFKLKVTQGDKITEVNIANTEDNGTKTHVNDNDVNQAQDVFIVKNTEEHCKQEATSENDLNIRIVIKNYKPNVKMKKEGDRNDFSKKISEKFHTVSTGYSDVCSGQNADNVYSIHRATIDLTSSTEKSKIQSRPSDECTSIELVKQIYSNFTVTSNSTKPSNSMSEHKIEAENNADKSNSSKRNIHINSQDFQIATRNENCIPVSDTEKQTSDENASNISSSGIIEKPRSIQDKKELLRKVFEKANDTKTKSRSKMKQLRDMLKIILTSDSSEPEDLAVTSNELAKDVTYASLKPNYFRDTDSMNNYYKPDSTISIEKQSVQKYYPTEERNSECSVNSEDTPEIKAQGCICSTLAERLNLCKTGEGSCCCRATPKQNEETCCDLNEDYSSLLNYKTFKEVHVETQNITSTPSETSKSNLNSAIESSLIKNCPAVLNQYEVSGELVKEGRSKRCFTKKHQKVKCNVKLNRTATLHISNRDEAIIVKTKPTRKKNRNEERRKENHGEIRRNDTVLTDLIPQADILQSYETKKAVLEIYTESTLSDDCRRFVAKLPKFVNTTENEIKNYEHTVANFKGVHKKNVVMSILR